MLNLKVSNLILIITLCFSFSCQSTPNFKMNDLEKLKLYEIEVDSRRIIQECYFMNAEKENNWRHQYILYILNEKNEAIPVYNPTNQDKDQCLAHFKKVERILKTTDRVKLCIRDRLEKISNPQDYPYELHDFGPLGKHESPYHALTFDTICSSDNKSKQCVSLSKTWTYTCPSFE